MCAINPHFRITHYIEAYTSDRKMTQDEFIQLVSELLLKAEIELNGNNRIRFHVRPMEA